MCLYPRMIRNKKYIKNQKNGGIIPSVNDVRVLHVPVGCGSCMECRKQKARGWQIRLLEDIKTNRNGKFITLTFSNESIKEIVSYIRQNEMKKNEEFLEGYGLDNQIATVGMRLFLERWRKKFKKSLRHWMVTELGHDGTENIHLHGIIWTDESMETVKEKWNYGYIWKGKEKGGRITNYVNGQTVNYIIKYLHKQDEDHKYYRSIVLTSPGMGNNYTANEKGDWTKNKFNGVDTKETYRTSTGHKISMPVYWRNKIYTDEEREKLWINRLDKQERWVGGERIDISKGEEEYYKLLEYYRTRNKQLGYGQGKVDWSREKYEHERRILLLKKRME